MSKPMMQTLKDSCGDGKNNHQSKDKGNDLLCGNTEILAVKYLFYQFYN